MKKSVLFLGTGGGRFVTMSQEKHTGGIILCLDSFQIHLDPGPGALIRLLDNGIKLSSNNVIIATHHHLDHANDCNVMIEGMTNGGFNKKGFLICTELVLKEVISKYHQDMVKEIKVLKKGKSFKLSDKVRVETIKCKHSHKDTYGLKFITEDSSIYFTSDTDIYNGFEKNLKGINVLIANTTRPGDEKVKGVHMCSNDLIKAVNSAEHDLKLIIITHFGARMIKKGPESEARRIKKETGIKTIAAHDGLLMDLD